MAEFSGEALSARPRAAALGRAGVVGVLLGLSVLLLAGQPSAEVPGVTTRESVQTGTTDGDADGPSANPAISADGRWVAFESTANNLTGDPGTDFRRIFLRDRETLDTSHVSIAPGGGSFTGDARNPSVSADGRHIAFEADVVRPPVEVIDWRNQLELLAYSIPIEGDGTTAIHIAGQVGEGFVGHTLFDADRDDDANPVFSPDRRRLAFTRGGEIWVRGLTPRGHPTDPRPEPITDSPPGTISDQPAWSPDGRRIVFRRTLQEPVSTEASTGLYVIDVVTGEEQQLTFTAGEAVDDAWPDWSPDGRWIAFSGQRDFGADTLSSIFVIEVLHDDGEVFPGDLSRVTSGAFEDRQPRWHPWQETLVFSRRAAQGDPSAIWVTDVVPAVVVLGDVSAAEFVEGSGARALTDGTVNDSRPAWTGEGLGVTFVSDRNGETDADLYRLPLDLGLEVDGDVELVSGAFGSISLPPGVTQSPHHAPVNLGLATPLGAEVRLRGTALGPPPQGSVRFEVFPCQDPEGVGCTPDAERTRQIGGLAPLEGDFAETLLRTSEMTPPYDFGADPDFHCVAADYSGDDFYRSTRVFDPEEGCLLMGRRQPTVGLEPMTNGSFGGLVARFQGPEGAPVPTGLVSFFLCGPEPGSNAAGCVEGGEQIDWVEPLAEGTADVFAPSELAPGRYCWRVEYGGDFDYHPLSYTDSTSACFVTADQYDPTLTGSVFEDQGPDQDTVLSGILHTGDRYLSEFGVGGSPPGRRLIWLCGPDEVAPHGCVEGGTLLQETELELLGEAGYFAVVPPGLAGRVGTSCLRVDYRWEGDPAGEEPQWADKSHTDAGDMCFTVAPAPFDTTTSLTSVFVHDRVAGETVLVSEALADEPADGDSYEPSISGDGSRVAFTSEASNLTTDDLLVEGENVYVRDLGAAPPATVLVSVPQSACPDGSCFGGSNEPSISADGDHVAFTTSAFHLDVVNPPEPDFLIGEFTQVVVRDLPAGTTTVESLGPDGQAGFGDSFEPSIDADGSRVAFTSWAQDLAAPEDDLSLDDVFLRDRAAEETLKVSAAEGGAEGNGQSGEPSISVDGRSVAFASTATNLAPDHPCVASEPSSACERFEVYVRDTVRGVTGQVSVGPDGAASQDAWDSRRPAIAGVGRHVAFDSASPELVPDDGNELNDVFVRDRTPVLVLTPDPLDLGPVLVDESSDVGTVVGVNAGSGPLEVSDVALTAGDVADFSIEATDCTGAVLHRTETCTVDVRFTPQAEGTRDAVLTVDSSDPEGPREVTVTGVGTRALAAVDPDPVDFGGWPVGTVSSPQVVTLTSVGSAPVSVSSVTLAGAHPDDFAILGDACSGQTLAALEGCAVTVRFTPSAAGARTAALVFTDTAEGSPRSVRLVGEGLVPIAEVSPDPVDFGEQLLATTSDPRVVTLVNAFPAGAAAQPPVLVHSSSVSLAGANPGDFLLDDGCGGAVLTPGEGCQVTVRFRPGALGARSATLVFTDNAAGSPRSVTLQGVGIAPDVPVGLLEADPDTVDFGDVVTGGDSSLTTVAVTSVGTAPVAISSVAVGGAHPGDFTTGGDCVGATLDPGEACTLQVRFRPQQPGDRSGAVRVGSDAEDTPETVALQGRGTQRALTVTDPVDFGVAAAGEGRALRTITVSSTGSAPVNLSTVALAGAGAPHFTVPAEGDGCSQSTLAPGERCGIAVVFRPEVTGAHRATLVVSSNATGAPHEARLAGLSPLLEPDPPLGPPGFVTEVVGTDFPPDTPLIVAWEPGIGSRAVVTDAGGSFRTFMLVLRRDATGPRTVEARGEGFTIAADFLVVPGTLQPDEFANRR